MQLTQNKISEKFHINDTAFMAALYRVQSRPNNSANNSELYQEINSYFNTTNIKINLNKMSKWIIDVRTDFFDQCLQNLINKNINGVINIGAGFDLRVLRISLPDNFKWIECDIGDIVELKRNFLKKIKMPCKYEIHTVDISKPLQVRSFIATIETNRKWLVHCEGVLCYLDESQIMSLSDILTNFNEIRYWTYDLNSPWAISKMNKQQKDYFQKGPYKIKFAPENGAEFLNNPPWNIIHIEQVANFAKKNKISIPVPWSILLKIADKETKRAFQNACSLIVMGKEYECY